MVNGPCAGWRQNVIRHATGRRSRRSRQGAAPCSGKAPSCIYTGPMDGYVTATTTATIRPHRGTRSTARVPRFPIEGVFGLAGPLYRVYRLRGDPTPAKADPFGDTYCFELGSRKDTGEDGWADVWKRHDFAWEYKGSRRLRRGIQAAPAGRPGVGAPAAVDRLRYAAVRIRTGLDERRSQHRWTTCHGITAYVLETSTTLSKAAAV